ncbi:YhjD/YihY/BrkB family envelope integrity protein [Actinospica robiniae]|uniref:YhjD/YihY/BrkB family envelope integrity protein n=1 Tax=Actinospica robiniae TaxID=304901 RepID=UPI001B7FB0D6|nr:YhjD/YihY/BrkB family envelope integrity protein [Actinospica robiniae]
MNRRSSELELMHRALGFAALGFVAMMPLLIVIADVSPVDYGGFGQWVVDGMGLSGQSESIVKGLFERTRGALSSTDALGLAVICVFGQSFASSFQSGYEKVWNLRPQMRHRLWQQTLWLATLTGQLYVVALSSHSVHAWVGLIRGICWVMLFWWGQWVLLGRRVPWRALLPGAVLTTVGLFGLRLFSKLVFAPMVVDSANTYGSVGIVLIVVTWLVAVGFVVFGGALLGEQCRHDSLGS